MTVTDRDWFSDPRVVDALEELRAMIAERYPEATFVVERGGDLPGVQLVATVDIDDTSPVYELVADRALEIQVAEGLPVYATAIRPVARVLADLRRREEARLGLLPPTG